MSNKIFDIISNEFKESIEFSVECNCVFIKDLSKWNTIAAFIIKNKNLKFDYLMCLSGYDLDENDQLGVAYNFSKADFRSWESEKNKNSYFNVICVLQTP